VVTRQVKPIGSRISAGNSRCASICWLAVRFAWIG
jgi:hypothetical protein